MRLALRIKQDGRCRYCGIKMRICFRTAAVRMLKLGAISIAVRMAAETLATTWPWRLVTVTRAAAASIGLATPREARRAL